ncbi:enoyl-CoA hydratase/isomerase family protein [Pseudomonas sp. UL073]|uniref:Enoyl-CoA hydratase/isomerase family protein n=1 Tax=Zestomonas insulae TaxID=2809017 RepID=A0ABS2IIG8_9GAMM|nr:enoyl-CoA hydratase/isomerase family protein [Pseudomonas insulae]MBM7061730.1 enoyl-CoA hydratase/isomerase family protein [Pseudomonas insulae]
MSTSTSFVPGRGLSLDLQGHVATLEFSRPPLNFFDKELISDLVAALEYLDELAQCRVVILQAEGKVFCAGADFTGSDENKDPGFPRRLYKFAVRLFRTRKPLIVVVEGAAIGGGLGLAMVGDFRVTSEKARFSANFNRLGIHQGFGISVTLPRLVGVQMASLLIATGRRIDGREAARIGLADVLAEPGQERQAALALAEEIALSAPHAVMSSRETLRMGLADAVDAIIDREASEQEWQIVMDDFAEGNKAMLERRDPVFTGK